MKKLLLSLLLLWQFNCELKAQVPFPDSAAIWINGAYSYTVNPVGQNPFLYFLSGTIDKYCMPGNDTTINSLTYSIVNYCSGTYKGAIRDNQNGKVFFIPKNDSVEVLLYDFSVNVNDSLVVYTEGLGNPDTVKLKVTAIGSTIVNGTTRKTLMIENGAEWIEGIGCSVGLFIDPRVNMNVSNFICVLHCMSHNDTSMYYAPTINYTTNYWPSGGFSGAGELNPGTAAPCDLALSMNELLQNENSISAFPNPSTGIFQITMNDKTYSRYEIINILGEVILNSQIVNSTAKIDLSAYDNGIYFVKVIDDKGISTTKKIIKH